MDNVVKFPGTGTVPFTYEDERESHIPVENVLESAVNNNLDNIIVIGREIDTDEFYLASSSNNVAKMLYFLELAKSRVMAIGNDSTD